MLLYEGHWFGHDDMYVPTEFESYTFPAHFHIAFEFIYIAEGTLEVTIDDAVNMLSANDSVLIFPNQIHSFRSITASRIYIVIFASEMVHYFSSKYIQQIPCCNIIKNIKLEKKDLFTDNICLQKALLYGVCGELEKRTAFQPAPSSEKNKLLHQILTFIDNNYATECSLKDAIKALNYDYSYVSRYFKHTVKMSYTQYLNKYRINKACYLLKNRRLPITAIASDCGFSNIRSFNYNFKKYTGTTPTGFTRVQ
jgi:AraC-like DNA-binding protein